MGSRKNVRNSPPYMAILYLINFANTGFFMLYSVSGVVNLDGTVGSVTTTRQYLFNRLNLARSFRVIRGQSPNDSVCNDDDFARSTRLAPVMLLQPSKVSNLSEGRAVKAFSPESVTCVWSRSRNFFLLSQFLGGRVVDSDPQLPSRRLR